MPDALEHRGRLMVQIRDVAVNSQRKRLMRTLLVILAGSLLLACSSGTRVVYMPHRPPR